jgi:beta-lactamase regulating signal transducer with metallopeptidase domain
MMPAAATWLLVFGFATTAVMVSAWIVTRLLKHRSGALRHFVWVAAFAATTAIPICSLALPRAGFSLPFTAIADNQPVPQTQTVEPAAAETQATLDVSQYELIGAQALPETASTPAADPTTKLIGLYALGVVAIACQAIAILLVLQFIRRRRSTLLTAKPQQAQLARRSGIRRAWDLRLCRGPYPPTAMTWGLRRPVVLLPEEAKTWTPERMEAVLLHELAHVRRLDFLSQMLGLAVCALHWFNPVVWLCARAMRAEAETAADDAVLESGVAPSVYADALVRIAAVLGSRRQPFASIGVPIMKRSKIEKRIEVILNPRVRRGATALEMLAVVCGGTALFVPLALMRPAIAQEPPPPLPAAQGAPTAVPPPPQGVQPARTATAPPAPARARNSKTKAPKAQRSRSSASGVSATVPPLPSRINPAGQPPAPAGTPMPPMGTTSVAPPAHLPSRPGQAVDPARTPSPTNTPMAIPPPNTRRESPARAGSTATIEPPTPSPAQEPARVGRMDVTVRPAEVRTPNRQSVSVGRVQLTRPAEAILRPQSVTVGGVRTTVNQRVDLAPQTVAGTPLTIGTSLPAQTGRVQGTTVRLAPGVASIVTGVRVQGKAPLGLSGTTIATDPSVLAPGNRMQVPATVTTGRTLQYKVQPAKVSYKWGLTQNKQGTGWVPAKAPDGRVYYRVTASTLQGTWLTPKSDIDMLESLKGELRPNSALARHLDTLRDLKGKLQRLQRSGSGADKVELARTKKDIATTEFQIAVELQRLRAKKGG